MTFQFTGFGWCLVTTSARILVIHQTDRVQADLPFAVRCLQITKCWYWMQVGTTGVSVIC